MGTGIHGSFGNTRESGVRYRIGQPVQITKKDYDMALDPIYYSNVIVQKYGIKLKGSGQQILIIFNSKLASSGRVREVRPNTIELGPLAFVDECELANTIAHELNHARSFLKGGTATEPPAYASGNRLADYIHGRC